MAIQPSTGRFLSDKASKAKIRPAYGHLKSTLSEFLDSSTAAVYPAKQQVVLIVSVIDFLRWPKIRKKFIGVKWVTVPTSGGGFRAKSWPVYGHLNVNL